MTIKTINLATDTFEKVFAYDRKMIRTSMDTCFFINLSFNTILRRFAHVNSAANHIIIVSHAAFYKQHFIIMYYNSTCAIPKPIISFFKSTIVSHIYLHKFTFYFFFVTNVVHLPNA